MLNVGALVAINQTLARNRNTMRHTIKRNQTCFINREKPKKSCLNCSHFDQETTIDVACCNCCDDGEFYNEIEKDPFNENDPYVVTNPMAFY